MASANAASAASFFDMRCHAASYASTIAAASRHEPLMRLIRRVGRPRQKLACIQADDTPRFSFENSAPPTPFLEFLLRRVDSASTPSMFFYYISAIHAQKVHSREQISDYAAQEAIIPFSPN